MITFGPVSSRRLGKSLGINNIPSFKKCSYSCIYCQVGPTHKMSVQRENLYAPEILFFETKKHLDQLKKEDFPDYLTFVSNGEPTLDQNLGESIRLLKTLQIPIAVITNGTLLNQSSVIQDLKEADWVSIKVDSIHQPTWKKINRPYKSIVFNDLKQSFLDFSREFKGLLVTETLLVEGVNDAEGHLHETAAFIAEIKPDTAYLSIPIRPPAVSTVTIPTEESINNAFQIYLSYLDKVILLNHFEGTETGTTGNAMEDIINMCTVHPIREDTMFKLLEKEKADPSIITILLNQNHIQKVSYKSHYFYIRNFHINRNI